jgi:chemotaxis signal transduction protein
VNEREKFHTPRTLAALLNSEAAKAEGAQEEPAALPASAANAAEPPRAPDRAVQRDAAVAQPSTVAERWAGGTRKRGLRADVWSGAGELDLIVFRVGGEFFAFPLDSVAGVLDGVELYALPDMPPGVQAVFSDAGRSTPLYSTLGFFGVATAADRPSVLLVKGQDGKGENIGVAVDAMIVSTRVAAAEIRRIPALEDAQGVLVGVFFHERELVTVLDPAVLTRDPKSALLAQTTGASRSSA